MPVLLENDRSLSHQRTHDLSVFGGLPLSDVLGGTDGFVTSVSYRAGNEILQATGDDIADLSAQTTVLKVTESQDLAYGSEALYPALGYLENIQYNNALIDELRRASFDRTLSRSEAAVQILKSVFQGKSLNAARNILDRWIEILQYNSDLYQSRSSDRGKAEQTAEGYLLVALGRVGIEEILRLPNMFPRALLEKLQDFDTSRIRNDTTNGMGHSMIALSFILDFPDKPAPALINQSCYGKDEAKRTASVLSMYAERLIARSVWEHLQTNSATTLNTLPRRFLPILDLYGKGYSAREIISFLGIPDTESQRKLVGRVLHQFAFSRPPGKPDYLRQSRVLAMDPDELTHCITQFCERSLQHQVQFSRKIAELGRNYRNLSFVKMFANRFLGLPPQERADLAEFILLGDSTEVARLLDTDRRLVNHFRAYFDYSFLDGMDIDTIYASEHTAQNRSLERMYANTIATIRACKLHYILPDSAAETVSFMGAYLKLAQKHMPDREIIHRLAQDFHYESSYVSILHQKASLLADLVTIVAAKPRGLGSRIMNAWTILDFVDKVKTGL